MRQSLPGIRLQVLFTGLAPNVVRWAQPWITNCAADPTPSVRRTLNSPQAQVRVAANATALIQQTADGTTIFWPAQRAARRRLSAARRASHSTALGLPAAVQNRI